MWHQIPLLHLLGARMPNHHDWERADLYQEDIARLKHELMAARAETQTAVTERNAAIAGNTRVIRALDAALQWGEALFAFLPEGTPLSDGVKTAKAALDAALQDIRR